MKGRGRSRVPSTEVEMALPEGSPWEAPRAEGRSGPGLPWRAMIAFGLLGAMTSAPFVGLLALFGSSGVSREPVEARPPGDALPTFLGMLVVALVATEVSVLLAWRPRALTSWGPVVTGALVPPTAVALLALGLGGGTAVRGGDPSAGLAVALLFAMLSLVPLVVRVPLSALMGWALGRRAGVPP